jgi:parvulin-like peptidyl-prolyl isomerase
MPRLRRFAAAALAAAMLPVFAADLPDDVLARNRWTDLTHEDYDAALERVPAEMRGEFSSSPKRVQGMLNALLVEKTLAAQAQAHGTHPSGFAKGDATPDRKSLAAAEVARIESEANAEFDAKLPDYVAKARELYAVDHAKYKVAETIRVADIAIAFGARGEDAALARAKEAHAKLAAGADFATIVREYSDDTQSRDRGGVLPYAIERNIAAPYAQAAFALPRIGAISEPIKGPNAWHIVRLDERVPAHERTFDEVKQQIVDTLRQRYVAERRDARIAAIHRDPELQVNQAAIDALVTHVDPRLFVPPAASSGETPATPPAAPPTGASANVSRSSAPPVK